MPPKQSPEPPTARPVVMALLDDIRAHPESDTPRLILADWLEDRSDRLDVARGEFLRLMLQKAHLAEELLPRQQKADPTWKRLGQRERELLARHGKEWRAAWQVCGRSATFHRGLVQLSPSRPEKLLTLNRDRLAEDERLAWIDGVTSYVPQASGIMCVLTCPLLGQINSLSLHFDFSSRSVDVLPLARGSAPRLVCLELNPCYSIHPHDLETLFRSPLAGQLRELRLRGTSQLRVGELLAGAPTLAHLACLVLEYSALDREQVRALASAPHLSGLDRLNIQRTQLRSETLTALLDRNSFPRLRSLDLGGNSLRKLDAADLANLPPRPGLCVLMLHWNQLTGRALAALAESPLLDQVEHLNLRINEITDLGVRSLARSPHSARLKHLDLGYNVIGDSGAKALADSPHLVNLVSLEMSYNRIGKKGQRALRDRFGNRVFGLRSQR